MDESRKQFEEWVSNRWITFSLVIRSNDPLSYLNKNTDFLWEAWQASREAMK